MVYTTHVTRHTQRDIVTQRYSHLTLRATRFYDCRSQSNKVSPQMVKDESFLHDLRLQTSSTKQLGLTPRPSQQSSAPQGCYSTTECVSDLESAGAKHGRSGSLTYHSVLLRTDRDMYTLEEGQPLQI